MFEMRDVTFAYGAVKAVNSVSISVEKGQIHGLIGPNGAGKSTVIDLISGKRKPVSGTVHINGDDITRRSVTWRRRSGIARSFQRISVFPEIKVSEQLQMVAKLMGERDLDTIIEALQLQSALDEFCREISYGEQRRVDVALALIGNPDLVLLDEPAAGLSRSDSLRLADHLSELARERAATVILVEHHLEVIFRVCEQLTVMAQGTVIASGDPEEVRKDQRVVEAYLGSASDA